MALKREVDSVEKIIEGDEEGKKFQKNLRKKEIIRHVKRAKIYLEILEKNKSAIYLKINSYK